VFKKNLCNSWKLWWKRNFKNFW